MSNDRKRILVIGSNWALLEGVSDLLELAGYEAELSSTWTEVERALQATPPGMVIIDLSSANPEALRVCARLQSLPSTPEVPILLMSFTGLQHIQEIRWSGGDNQDGRLQFYSDTLLGPRTLLEKVEECLQGTQGDGSRPHAARPTGRTLALV